ncbi:hypothetical protein [Roseovarius sp. TE539]|uniref:hypothetical protein n=1 Tax=Roseovarius sp. TE539 TaxID=2249812 RepID=UPI00215C70AC|nr:hypothetical protein [Roseovarius sp. TE539]
MHFFLVRQATSIQRIIKDSVSYLPLVQNVMRYLMGDGETTPHCWMATVHKNSETAFPAARRVFLNLS